MDPLEAAATLDWVTTVIGMIKVAQGYRPISCDWGDGTPPAHYEKVLRKKGIRVTAGGIVAGKGFVLLVPKDKAAIARRILANAGAALA